MTKKSDKQSPHGAQRGVQSIEVGFKIIRALEIAEHPLPLREIAAAAELSPSQAHIYLVSFIREGLAYQDLTSGHYGLGPYAIQLGLSAIRQLDVVALAQEELAMLQRSTGFAAYLSLWGNRGPSIVAKVDGFAQGSLAVRVGYVLPLLTSATGLVFLAHMDNEATRGLREEEILGSSSVSSIDHMQPESVPVPQDIEKLTKAVRSNGYAMTTNSMNSNFGAVAAPAFDFNGRIVAALTILAPIRMIGTRKAETIAALLEATRRLSSRMGYVERTSR